MKRLLFVALLLFVMPFTAFGEEAATVAQPEVVYATEIAADADAETLQVLHQHMLAVMKHMTNEQLAAIVGNAETLLAQREGAVTAGQAEAELIDASMLPQDNVDAGQPVPIEAAQPAPEAKYLGDCVSHPMMHPCPEIQHLELGALVADSTESVIETVVADNERLASLPMKPESFRIIENEETGAKNLFAVVPGELVRNGDGPYHWKPALWKESVDLKANAYDDIAPDHAFLKLWYKANSEFNPELANSPARMGGWNERLMYHPKDTEVGAMLIPLLTLNEAQEAQVTQWMEHGGDVLTVALEHR